MSPPILEVRQAVKRFGGTLALDRVDLDVAPGEVHALLGQNGAGKSTLIKILAGVHALDEGEVRFRGEELKGIPHRRAGFVHQDLGLVDGMTVAENVALTAGYSRRGPLISWRNVRRRAQEVLSGLQTSIDPEKPVASLSQGERAILGVARALSLEGAELLVLDEPTASLPRAEADRLFEALEALRERGVGILYVTHRLDEVFRLANRVTVLRDGRGIGTVSTSDTTPSDLVEMIVGHSVGGARVGRSRRAGQPLLELDGLVLLDVGPLSLSVSESECVALVGLQGAGQETVGRAVFGLRRVQAGEIRLRGAPLRTRHPIDAIRRGVGFVSGNRNDESIVSTMTVRENLFLNPTEYRSASPIGRRDERRRAVDAAARFDIRPRGGERLIHTLSGGNQQKVVLARWLTQAASLLILEEPTAGVDVEAKEAIRELLRSFLAGGGGVVLVSSDFEDVVELADRAYVFHRGEVVAELGCEEITVRRLTALAGGANAATDGDAPA